MANLRETRLSIIHPFYNEQDRLKIHVDNWYTYPKKYLEAIDFVLVDDASPNKELVLWMDFYRLKIPYFAIFRITDNLRWNTPGALNLGVLKSLTDWVLFMDSDCLMLKEDIETLLDFEPDPECAYYFPRNRICDDEKIRIAKGDRCLPCAILIHKKLFEEIGGFDEDFTGERSNGYAHFDSDFSHRLGKPRRRYLIGHDIPNRDSIYEIGPRIVIQEYMEDKVGPNIQTASSVTERHIRRNKLLWYRKINGVTPRNTEHLRFPWVLQIDKRKNRRKI